MYPSPFGELQARHEILSELSRRGNGWYICGLVAALAEYASLPRCVVTRSGVSDVHRVLLRGSVPNFHRFCGKVRVSIFPNSHSLTLTMSVRVTVTKNAIDTRRRRSFPKRAGAEVALRPKAETRSLSTNPSRFNSTLIAESPQITMPPAHAIQRKCSLLVQHLHPSGAGTSPFAYALRHVHCFHRSLR